jgi:hypothetical protein
LWHSFTYKSESAVASIRSVGNILAILLEKLKAKALSLDIKRKSGIPSSKLKF